MTDLNYGESPEGLGVYVREFPDEPEQAPG